MAFSSGSSPTIPDRILEFSSSSCSCGVVYSRSNWNLKVLVFCRRGKKPANSEKNPWSKDENQQQTQPTYDAGYKNRTRAILVGGQCSHHFAVRPIPASQLTWLIKARIKGYFAFTCRSAFRLAIHFNQLAAGGPSIASKQNCTRTRTSISICYFISVRESTIWVAFLCKCLFLPIKILSNLRSHCKFYNFRFTWSRKFFHKSKRNCLNLFAIVSSYTSSLSKWVFRRANYPGPINLTRLFTHFFTSNFHH